MITGSKGTLNTPKRKDRGKPGTMFSRSLDALSGHRKNLDKKRQQVRTKVGSSIFGKDTMKSINEYRKARRGK